MANGAPLGLCTVPGSSDADRIESKRSTSIPAMGILGRDALGVDIQPGVWHTMAVLTEHVVCFEVKPGPYSAATDKDFAPWAPREGDQRATAYLEWLVTSVVPPML